MSLSSGRTRTSTGSAAAPTRALSSPSSSPAGDSSPRDHDDPFAPPPEDAPDRPWQPRTPPLGGNGPAGPGQGSGREERDTPDDGDRQDGRPGGSWSNRQPGRQDGGFGGLGNGPSGRGPGTGFDVNDPVQRRARYALLAGMWAFFFSLFGMPQIALLLGAFALYWWITSLRDKPRGAAAGKDGARGGRTGRPGAFAARPQRTAAMSGIVTGALALVMVFGLFVTQLVYRDYFECVSDALTTKARESCSEKMPEWLRPWAQER